MSAANLVFTNSRGYTITKDVAPAMAPDIMLPSKYSSYES